MISIKKLLKLYERGDISLLSEREIAGALWMLAQEQANEEEAAS